MFKKNLELILKIRNNPKFIYKFGFGNFLSKIISHLINNAIKFTEKGSIILGFNKNDGT